MIAFLFYVIGWVVSLNIVKKPAPIMWPLGLLTGWVIGLLLVARIYLIEEENKEHRVWIYLLAILCGFLTYVTEMRYVIHVIPKIRLFGKFLPVGLLYLGYLGLKIRIRYLQKRKINRWREEGVKR